MKGKRRDTNKAVNETDASTCCDLSLFIQSCMSYYGIFIYCLLLPIVYAVS